MDRESARKIFAGDRFAALTGVEIVDAGAGYCKAKLVIEDRHLNAANVVQGGAIFTLADLAFGVAANSHGQLALAINVNISYLSGKSSGTLYATATEIGDPRRLGAYDVLVTDELDNLIARFNGMVYRKNQHLPTR
ncbi:MAG: PaaI family thioesterase [Desulfocapsaceae bacterium]|nr:PaaI family thioesterase [Desulfocapsaceae bacterium]